MPNISSHLHVLECVLNINNLSQEAMCPRSRTFTNFVKRHTELCPLVMSISYINSEPFYPSKAEHTKLI